MAVGLTAAMTTARASLLATQQALTVTSNNIANASTTGYHKQNVNFSDNVQILTNTGYYGTGVSVTGITRTYSAALESSLSAAKSSDGYNQTYLDYASQVEDLIAPGGDSALVDSMSAYMKAIQDLQTNPEDNTYRESLLSAARTLSDDLNTAYTSLDTIKTGLANWDGVSTNTDPSTGTVYDVATGGTAADSVADVNDILSQLTDLNDQISNLETYSSNKSVSNDLRDQRDALVQELSTYMGVSVSEDSYGRYTITSTDSSGGSVTLLGVSGTGVSNYKTYANTVHGEFSSATSNYPALQFSVYYDRDGNGTAERIALGDTGELGGYSDSYSYISNEMRQIYNEDYVYNPGGADTGYPGYAQAIAVNVNRQLLLGEGLNGAAGVNMFDPTIISGPYSGSVLTVSSTITASTIAASDVDPTSANPAENGNGDNMANLWNLLNSTNVSVYSKTSGGAESPVSRTLGGYPDNYVNDIAMAASGAKSNASTSSATVTMYKNAISSQSGVSSDEEITNMLALQNAYAASAKVINTVQAMYDAILSAV